MLALVLLSACSGDKSDDTAETDTDTDTDSDTDTDTDTDSDTDTDTDTDTDGTWAHCPDGSAWVGDSSWTGLLTATSHADYCSGSNEGRTIPQELAAKARLKVVAGSWPMPAAEGTYDMALAMCTVTADPNAQPAMAGTGSTEVSPSSFGGTTYTYLRGSQPMSSTDGTSWNLDHTIILVGDEGAAPNELVLDGAAADPTTGASATFVLYSDSETAYDVTAKTFQPCLDDGWIRNVHSVEYDGGNIEIEVYIGTDVVITAPAMFTHATGTLDGESFDITNYFQLVYRPDHHHFGRHFAVLFDAPIGDACGLLVEDVDGQAGTTTAVISTADCSLGALESRATTSEDWTTGG